MAGEESTGPRRYAPGHESAGLAAIARALSSRANEVEEVEAKRDDAHGGGGERGCEEEGAARLAKRRRKKEERARRSDARGGFDVVHTVCAVHTWIGRTFLFGIQRFSPHDL